MRTWRHIFLLLAIGLCGSGAFAGSRNVEDISNLTIHSFAQDLKGYVWIATDNGLCRYNGNDYLHYYHDAEGTGSLPSNTVLSLVTDDDGVLWVATDRGVCWYDGTNDSFELVDGVPGVSKLAFNDGKVICYGAGQGMTLLDPKKKRIDSVHNTPSHDVAVLVADRSGCLWGGHSDGIHIVKFDKSAAVVASEALPEKSAFRSVAVDSLGRVWFGRNDGLLIRDTGTMESVEDSRLAKLAGLVSGHAVTTILSVLGTMYVCMPGVGIYTVELDDGSVRKDAVKRFDLSYTSDFSCGFRDSENHPWIGTMDRGYGVRFLEKKNFKYVPALGRATSGKYINCVTASVSSNTVWMASYYKGLLAFDIPTSKHVWYNYGKCRPLDAIGEKGVKALALDGKNRLWIAMAGKVAVCGTRGSEILDSKVVADGIEMNAFCEDGDGTMWAATPVGVVRLDGGTDDCRLLQGSDIQDIIRFDEDRLLVAVKDSGLFFVAPKTLRVERYILAGDDAKRNLGDVSCLYIQNGELWIGTSSKGLLRCRGNEVVNEYSIRNGLGSNDVASIAADPEGNVWVGTSYGLSVVTKRFDKPITYYQGRWMDTQQFCKRSAGSHSGRMFFGGNMGLAFFFSDRIISNISDEPVNVVLTGLSVNGVDQKPGEGEILDRLLDDTDRIVLKSSQNSIGIRFEPVSFIAEDNIGFSYRLTGKYADDEWNDIGGYRRVNFSHLPPGHYVFELKASNVDGFWSKDPRRLEIIIRKSPWLSWYALLAYLSLAVAGMMAVSRFIIKRRMEEMELAVNAQVRKEGGMRFVFALPADESLYEITESAKDFRSDVIDGMLVVDPVKDEAVEEDGNSERYKVLVFEDNASLLAWLKEILSSRYDVYTASDGADALDIVNDVLPDMVLTDIIMPKVDGYELCRRIKEDKLLSHIPVVILTSRTGDEDRLIGYQHGADLYVTKPFSAEMIMTLIGNVLATREKLRERFTSQEEIEDDGRQGNEADIISAEDRAFIDRLRKYIEDNISETSISITSLAGEMCMSRASFFRKMKSLTGMTPNDFILTYRVNKAAAMLREGKWRIGEIADMLGFSSASHFSRVFRQRFGKTPKEFTQ